MLKNIIVIVALVLTQTAIAKKRNINDVVCLFVNGMMNEKNWAENSARVLNNALKNDKRMMGLNCSLQYNTTMGLFDLARSAEYAFNNDELSLLEARLYSWVVKSATPRQTFLELNEMEIKKYDEISTQLGVGDIQRKIIPREEEVRNFIDQLGKKFLQTITSGHPLILVAHSEGNFVVREAVKKYNLCNVAMGNLRIIAIGTPANSIPCGGSYVTLHGDRLINDILSSIIKPLQSNTPGDGHEFVGAYMLPNSPGEKKIMDLIASAISDLVDTTPPTKTSVDANPHEDFVRIDRAASVGGSGISFPSSIWEIPPVEDLSKYLGLENPSTGIKKNTGSFSGHADAAPVYKDTPTSSTHKRVKKRPPTTTVGELSGSGTGQ